MKKLTLGTKILIAFVGGIALGFLFLALFGERAGEITDTFIAPFSTLFLNLIKMVCIPLVFCSLVMGTCSTGDVKSMGRIGGKTFVCFMYTSMLGLLIGLAVTNFAHPGAGLNVSTEGLVFSPTGEMPRLIDTLLNILPTNIFVSLTSGNMLQIIAFSIIVGIGINMAGEKVRTVKDFFEAFGEIMNKIVGLIMWYAPIAICAMMICTIATYGPSMLGQYLIVYILLCVGAVLQVVLAYFPLVGLYCRYSIITFLKNCFPSFSLAYSTQSSNATLPVTMEDSSKLGVSSPVASFVLPLGCTINMDGTAIYNAIVAMFVANVYGMPLTVNQQLQVVIMAMLSSIGSVGVPGGGLIMLGTVLTSVGLPIEGIALVLGLQPLVSPVCTAMNVLGDLAVAMFIDKTEKKYIQNT